MLTPHRGSAWGPPSRDDTSRPGPGVMARPGPEQGSGPGRNVRARRPAPPGSERADVVEARVVGRGVAGVVVERWHPVVVAAQIEPTACVVEPGVVVGHPAVGQAVVGRVVDLEAGR